jgi:protein-S-isoprenylcysteine O-methyltransferase Ste14
MKNKIKSNLQLNARKWWKKNISGLVIVAAVLLVSAGRFYWFAAWLYLGAVLLIILINAMKVAPELMAANLYFSATVRLQSDRAHSVAKSGPYSVIRHPGYTAGIISIMATPLLLESWFALIPASLVAVAYIIRTALEDSFLQKNLPGYQDYRSTVQYRLIPGLW